MDTKPELLPLFEFIALRFASLRAAGIEGAESIHQTGKGQVSHVAAVRAAVDDHRDIHADNLVEYRSIIPGLARYSINGNTAVYDRYRKPITPAQRAQQHRAAIQLSDLQERRKEARSNARL
jgi:hypothetical protein